MNILISQFSISTRVPRFLASLLLFDYSEVRVTNIPVTKKECDISRASGKDGLETFFKIESGLPAINSLLHYFNAACNHSVVVILHSII